MAINDAEYRCVSLGVHRNLNKERVFSAKSLARGRETEGYEMVHP